MGRRFQSRKYDLAVDTIDRGDIERVIDWLCEYPRLTMDVETRRFERMWADWLGVEYCVACNSGSSANLLMCAALESGGRAPGKKVAVPATGWATSIAPFLQQGWQPHICETDRRTFGIDAGGLEEIVKRERPDAVIIVHVLGVPNDMEPILRLQGQYGFELLEDCCASHGSRHRGQLVGTFGAMSSFSFYFGHHMSTIEGGVVCTNDRELYCHLLMARSHGWTKDLPADEYDQLADAYGIDPFHFPFTFVLPGYNLRPTDLSSFIGTLQLARLGEVVLRRVANHRLYQKLLDGYLDFAPGVPGDEISSISFCALARSPEERRAIVQGLDRRAIDTRLFTAGNLGRHPFWFERHGVFAAPVADRLYNCGFFLPNNQTLKNGDIEFIAGVVVAAVQAYRGPA